MAGTLTISTLSDGTNSTSSTNCIQGSAKAWVNFNGTGTPAIRASYNVSSITDSGTGKYEVNLTNALSDANYCVTGTCGRTTNDDNCALGSTNTSSSQVHVETWTTANAATDFDYVSVAVFR